ncbi:MAG: dTDP-4-dehydrorhamnose 3,5-epimerase [Nitrospinae bacterium]|nr:dTDP-4-dehydrorhamnose 3,5-epimerase [Nitrospinota bacterium]
MKIHETRLSGVILLEPKVFGDPRGFFLETYHQEKYRAVGLHKPFVQDNHSFSRRGALRGLHYQLRHPQGKLIYVLSGEIYDVAVDIRRGSPTFGKWEPFILSAGNKRQLFIPEGFAHGFYVLSEGADVLYKCTDLYDAKEDCGILWSDPGLGIEWPIPEGEKPNLSPKDERYPILSEALEDELPGY